MCSDGYTRDSRCTRGGGVGWQIWSRVLVKEKSALSYGQGWGYVVCRITITVTVRCKAVGVLAKVVVRAVVGARTRVDG